LGLDSEGAIFSPFFENLVEKKKNQNVFSSNFAAPFAFFEIQKVQEIAHSPLFNKTKNFQEIKQNFILFPYFQ